MTHRGTSERLLAGSKIIFVIIIDMTLLGAFSRRDHELFWLMHRT